MNLLIYITFLFCGLFSSSCIELAAQQEHRWTVAELLNTALNNNPETKLTWWNAQRAAASLGNANSAYYPRIDFNANVTHGRDFKFTNGPNVNYTTLQADVIFGFLLADSGERDANVRAYRMSFEAAGWESDYAIQKVMAQVYTNGYSTLLAQEILEALIISKEDAKKMLDAATKLNRAGLSPVSDVYSSQAALAQIKMEVAEQKGLVDIERAKLAVTLGFEADAPIKLMPIGALEVPVQKLPELICFAKQSRQDLMAKRAKVQEAIAEKVRTNAKYYPKLTLDGRGGAEHAVKDRASAGHYQIALNFDVPLFTGFENIYQNRVALANIKISEQELLQLELDISQEVLTQSRTIEYTRKMLRYAKENLDYAQKAYNATLEKYNAGKERIAEVSITLRQIVNARVRLSEVHTRYLTAAANLAFAMGTLGYPPLEVSCIKK